MYVKLSYCQYQMLLGMAHQTRSPEARQMPSPDQLLQEAAQSVQATTGSEGASGAALGGDMQGEAQIADLARRYAGNTHHGPEVH